MELLIAILIGFLFGMGVYGLLRRSMVRVIVGVLLISQAVNLLVFFSGGMMRGTPVITDGSSTIPMPDPLPQALVLTAIVIGFGLIAFVITLFQRVYISTGDDDTNSFSATDR
jgi:multicomponent Na+:H+ antiporter subunit C